MRIARFGIASTLILAGSLVMACGDDDDGDDDDDVIVADASPGGPDAPANIDAAPDTPDAAAGVDAADVDASDVDAGGDDAATGEDAGGLDGGAIEGCAPTGDYVEAEEATNDLFELDTAAETSGQTVDPSSPTSSFTVGGCIDPAQATADVTDADFYEFTVAADGPVRVVLENLAATPPAGNMFVVIYDATTSSAVAVGLSEDGTAVLASVTLPAGAYFLAVYHELPAIAETYTYRATVTTGFTCNPKAPPADFTEANDGTGSRDNDMITFDVDSTPTVLELSASTTDAPEPTSITTTAGASYLIQGVSADVGAVASYLDGDTFELNVGADTTELHVVLSWPDGALADMDTLLMNAGVVDPLIAASLFISTTADEVMIAPVDPGSYWVWAATYDDAVAPTLPVSYDITICAF